jgi:cytochrome c-type biogenesis protein CcmH/NrfG
MNSIPRKRSGSGSKRVRPGVIWAGAIVILLFGGMIGYLIHHTSTSQVESAGVDLAVAVQGSGPSGRNQSAFDAGMRPLLERLKSNPNDAALLTEIGNRYYDHQDWSRAVEYYRRSLQLEPDNVNVRTDMGTAIWYGGDPWDAIRAYKTALFYQPDYAQALFNMGVVQWQGEHDDRAALQSWQTLLRVHPEYADRQKVEQLMQQVQAEVNQQGAATSGR